MNVVQAKEPSLRELEARLAIPPAGAVFTDQELAGLPEPVRRYLRAAIAVGTPLASSARLVQRGSIKLGKRWLPFRARQVLAPHHGSVWAARVAGVMTGSDQYADGEGRMRWKLLGLIPVMRADGPDTSRSAAGRFGGEAMWVPTTLLPRFGVTWTAESDTHITARFSVDEVGLALRITIAGDGLMRTLEFDRWGDADNSGTSRLHPFGLDVTACGTFGGVTIPRAGHGGWFHGTPRWDEGEFFRYEITSLELIS